MGENPTVVNLSDVRKETDTSTGASPSEQKMGMQGSQRELLDAINRLVLNKNSEPSNPMGTFHTIAIWVVIAFIIGWLAWLSTAFYAESKELNDKISENQQQLIKTISSSQIDVKNQISSFERRHESDFRELQKMILQGSDKP